MAQPSRNTANLKLRGKGEGLGEASPALLTASLLDLSGAATGLVRLAADGGSAAALGILSAASVSGGIAPDTIDGAVTLNDGGLWTQTAIQVAPTSFGSTSNTLAVAASPSSLPTTLEAQQIMLGLDGNIDIPGTFKSGTLEISGGSAVRAETVTLAQNGVITLDTTSTLVIGGSLPSAGLVTVGSAGTLRVERGSINTGVSLDGSLWVSEAFVIGFVPGSLSIAGSLTGAGTVDIQGTLDVADAQGFTGTIDVSGHPGSIIFSGTLRLHQGGLPDGLLKMNGGTVDLLGVPSTGAVLGYDRNSGLLTLGAAVLDVGAGLSLVDFSATSDGAGGTLVTQTGTASSSIAPDTIDGAVTLNDGGLWTQTTIQVAPTSFGSTSNTLAVAASPSSLPTTLEAQQIMLGLDGSIDIPGTFKSGTLEISGGSAVRAETVTLAQNGVITLDTTSTLVIGGGLPSAGLVTVGSAGTLRVERGSINTGVSLDGSLWVSEAFVIGLVPGSLSIAGSLTGAGTVDIEGTLDVADAQGFTGTIDVSGHPGSIIFSGTLRLHQGGLANGLVKMDGGTLDLPDVPYSGATAQYDPVTGELTVGGVMVDVGAGSSLAHFTLLPDETGGTKVTGAALPCFAAGTSLLTPDGPRRVKTLAAGDAVTVLDGTARTIRWTGQRTVDCPAHPHPAKVWPVRIAAHAFGPGLPARPLHLSPDHAVYAAGLLTPIRCLLNGHSIRQEQAARVTYCHIELDRHDIVLAEGLPAESYLDTGNRNAFVNGAAMALHPVFGGPADVWEAEGYAPLTLTGKALDALRAALAQLADLAA